MCLYPRFRINPKYKENNKNGGVIPAIRDFRLLYVPIGCEECIECRKQKARGWQLRLLEDIKQHTNGKFVTLTLSNESYKKLYQECEGKEGNPFELDNDIATRAMHLFRERWRKQTKKSPRHFFVTELGHNGTENIHLHGIIWTDKTPDEVKALWQYGYIWPRNNTWKGTYVNEQTVNYIIKYVTKKDEKYTTYKSRILTSPGIGGNYTKTGNYKRNTFIGDTTDETYRTSTGHKISMPVYWRNKIYTDEQREELWLQKLDKEERWILGSRVDVSKNDKEYIEGLKWARAKNKQLGYGDGTKTKEEEEYQWQRRKIMQLTRIEKANKKGPK